MTGPAAEPTLLGRVTGLFGVRGFVRLYSYTEPREAILEYDKLKFRSGDSWQPVQIAEGQRHGKAVIARFVGIADRDAAASLVGGEIGILRDDLPDPGDGQYYWSDLEGLTVIRRDETVLGTVDGILATGANDVLVVKGDSEVLVPFLPGDVVLEVDIDAGIIRVDWEWD